MPRRDKTGPMGSGSMQGRGLGLCSTKNNTQGRTEFNIRTGLRCRRGYGRSNSLAFHASQISFSTEKEILQEERNLLQNRLVNIEQQLANKQ